MELRAERGLPLRRLSSLAAVSFKEFAKACSRSISDSTWFRNRAAIGPTTAKLYVMYEDHKRKMAKKGFIPVKLRPWIEARKKYRLSHAQVQMARELGMNPKKFGSLANHRQQPWKLPLPQFIEHCYEKRFGKELPDDIRPIEVKVAEKAARKKE